LGDGGYVSLEVIDCAAAQQVELYMPMPEPNKNSKVADRFARRAEDSGYAE